MPKIKCLYITFNGLLEPLGQAQVLPYIEGLSKRGVKFYLISLEKKKAKAKIEKIKEKLKKLDVDWYKLQYFGNLPIKLLFSIFQTFCLSFYLVLFKKINLIHTRAYYPMFSVLWLKKLFSLKIIFDTRGFIPEELVDAGRIKKSSFYYKLLKVLEKKSILRSDYLITLTPEAIDIIKENYGERTPKAIWMPTCVDEKRFEAKAKVSFEDKFLMVYQGSLWSYYNMGAMIDFFKVLKKKIKNAHFLVLGNNRLEGLYPLFSQKELKSEEYTLLQVSPSEVPKYLKASNLGISFIYEMPSKVASFPTKIAEYLISGLPVALNTQCRFLREIIRKNRVGLIIENFDKKALARGASEIQFLLGDKELRQRCKKTAQKYLAKDICVEKYWQVYQGLFS